MGGKGLIAAAILLAMVALLSACGDGGIPEEEEQIGASPEVQQEEEEEEQEEQEEQEEILDLPDEEQIRILLERNLEANEEADSRALFEQYAPSQLRGCSYEDVKEFLGEGGPGSGGSDVTYRDLVITVDGDAAGATLVLQLDGLDVPVTAEQPLRFIKEEGGWYFEASLEMRDLCEG